MRITIESTGPGLYKMSVEQSGEVERGELMTRTEVERKVWVCLWRENKRNGVKDKQPLEATYVTIPFTGWLTGWLKRNRK